MRNTTKTQGRVCWMSFRFLQGEEGEVAKEKLSNRRQQQWQCPLWRVGVLLPPLEEVS